MSSINLEKHKQMANAVRALSMDAVEKAASGHPGLPLGAADIATVLFQHFLKFDPKNPHWPNRDRFVLSAGHGSMLLYSLLFLSGYEDMTIEEIKNFRKLGSKCAGHPEYGLAGGIETTTGPLGQGIANAVGMAIAERRAQEMFSSDTIDHYTYALAGDGCLMEGISFEAMGIAASLRLNKLIVLFDDNQISIDGPTSLVRREDIMQRIEACGWNTIKCDGHNPEEIFQALTSAKSKKDAPTFIACRTKIGFGAPNKEGTAKSHGSPLGADEIELARKRLNWPHAPFEIPEDILKLWRGAVDRGAVAYSNWRQQVSDEQQAKLTKFLAKGIDKEARSILQEVAQTFAETQDASASRQSSQKTLAKLAPAFAGLLGGSADLTGSNGTFTAEHKVMDESNDGNYINYGVREHGMAGVMNGIALWGGFIPYGGTFLVFSDYMRPSMRLAALMGIQVIYVLTHDSIGLGEDGPTHQPVEHLPALRAIPNLNVFRPADSVEVAQCWLAALEDKNTPSVMCLSRQGLPCLHKDASQAHNQSAKGGYVLIKPPADKKRDATLIASGSELQLAVEASKTLAQQGINVAVVSLPWREQFLKQADDYRKQVLGDAPRIGIEAALSFGWKEILGDNSDFVGMKSFGESAPIKDLYQHFGITSEAIVKAVKQKL